MIAEHPHICSCISSFLKYAFSKAPSFYLWGSTVPYHSLECLELAVSGRGQPLVTLLKGHSFSPLHAQNLETYIQYNHNDSKKSICLCIKFPVYLLCSLLLTLSLGLTKKSVALFSLFLHHQIFVHIDQIPSIPKTDQRSPRSLSLLSCDKCFCSFIILVALP